MHNNFLEFKQTYEIISILLSTFKNSRFSANHTVHQMFLITDWSTREWLSAWGMLLFGVIGGIIQIIYLIPLFKHRKNKLLHKHLKVRGKAMYITYCIVNFHWASIHPILVGIVFFYFPHKLSILLLLYSFGLILLDTAITLYCTRCWVLYFNFNYYALQFEKLWKSKLLSNHFSLSWYEITFLFDHPQFQMHCIQISTF